MADLTSPTTKFLDELELIMKTAYEEFIFQGPEHEAEEVGARLTERTHSQIVRGMSPESAKSVTKLLGQRSKIAKYLENKTEEISPLDDLAMLINYTILPDRDEARRYASRISYRAGEEFFAARNKKSAAISFTNSAVCILELFYPTKEELWLVHQTLSQTRNWRQKGSIDAAYHNFQLSLVTKKLLAVGEIPPSLETFRKVLRGFDRAHQLFQQHEHHFDVKTYYRNIIETLTTWLTWQNSKTEQALTDAIPELIPLQDRLQGASNTQIVSTLRANPSVLGFDQTPAWVPPQADILSQSINKIPGFDDRLNSATDFVSLNSDTTDELELGINRLRDILAPLRGRPGLPFDELNALWLTKDYEAYLTRALEALSITATANDNSMKYEETLSRVREGILFLRTTWPEPRLHNFLRRYPAELRFTACELGRLEQWEGAFHLLELTRGLIASNTASLMHSDKKEATSEDDFMWIHLTHSPTGTYLICTQSGRYFGVEIPELSGRVLTPLFSGFHPPGLLSPASRHSRKTRRDSVARISAALTPVVEWILSQNSTTIVLQPGGYFQAFPIWSVGAMPDAIERGDIFLFQVPSQSLSANKPNYTTRTGKSLSIQEAATVPYQTPLPSAEEECSWIVKTAPPGWTSSLEAGTPRSILQASTENDFVHFAGHSSSHHDPLQSELHTYGGPLTVENILSSPAKAQLVVLGSCESGLPQNFQLQDEYLSVQSAFWYSGVSYVAGTHWSVSDRAAAEFATAFYESLFAKISAEDLPVSHAIYLSWVKAVSTLRGSFTDPLDWAAFSLVGSPIADPSS